MDPPRHRPVEIRDLGRRDYTEVLLLQHALVEERSPAAPGAVDRNDLILLVEHPPVITVGRRGAGPTFTPPTDIPIVEVERGGEATYHGPGQVVLYPILRLAEGERDLHRYLRTLEQAIIDVLGRRGVTGERVDGKTGVWVGGRKIASIGVAVRRWVTYHGLALNLATDLAAYRGFSPCGLPADVMDNVGHRLDPALGVAETGRELARRLCSLLDRVPL